MTNPLYWIKQICSVVNMLNCRLLFHWGAAI